MDRETMKRIQQIQRGIPKHLIKNLTKKERDDSEDRMVKWAIESNRLSKEDAKHLDKLRQEGHFIKKTEVRNEAVEKEIGKYLDGKIAAEKAAGRLKTPERDEWMKRMDGHHGRGI